MVWVTSRCYRTARPDTYSFKGQKLKRKDRVEFIKDSSGYLDETDVLPVNYIHEGKHHKSTFIHRIMGVFKAQLLKVFVCLQLHNCDKVEFVIKLPLKLRKMGLKSVKFDVDTLQVGK